MEIKIIMKIINIKAFIGFKILLKFTGTTGVFPLHVTVEYIQNSIRNYLTYNFKDILFIEL